MEKTNKYQFNSAEHLHLLNGVALTGTTSILDVLGKPLTWWASGKAVETLGWTNEYQTIDGKRTKVDLKGRVTHCVPFWREITGLDVETYLSRLNDAYKAHSVNLKDTADAGTDLHAELERFVKNTIANRMATYNERIQPFIVWTTENVKRFIGSEIYVYDEDLFIGGVIDCVAELKDGRIIIIDFKSSKEAYFSQFVQCALYGLQLKKNGGHDENGNLLFKIAKPISTYIVFPFGGKTLIPVENNNISQLQESAIACVNIYRAKADFEK